MSQYLGSESMVLSTMLVQYIELYMIDLKTKWPAKIFHGQISTARQHTHIQGAHLLYFQSGGTCIMKLCIAYFIVS